MVLPDPLYCLQQSLYLAQGLPELVVVMKLKKKSREKEKGKS